MDNSTIQQMKIKYGIPDKYQFTIFHRGLYHFDYMDSTIKVNPVDTSAVLEEWSDDGMQLMRWSWIKTGP